MVVHMQHRGPCFHKSAQVMTADKTIMQIEVNISEKLWCCPQAASVKKQYVTDPSMTGIYFQLYGQPFLGIFGLACEEQVLAFSNPNFHVVPMTAKMGARGFSGGRFWSWQEGLSNMGYSVYQGAPKSATVTPAFMGTGFLPCVVPQLPNGLQGWLNNGSIAGQGTLGRNNGTTFRNFFSTATATGARIILVKAFNQWTGCPANPGENYSPEFSTDIEPMAGGFGSQYLDLLKELTATFKQAVQHSPVLSTAVVQPPTLTMQSPPIPSPSTADPSPPQTVSSPPTVVPSPSTAAPVQTSCI